MGSTPRRVWRRSPKGLAEPGGIRVSGRVRTDVVGKIDVVDFTDMGEQQLKNICRPMRCSRHSSARNGGWCDAIRHMPWPKFFCECDPPHTFGASLNLSYQEWITLSSESRVKSLKTGICFLWLAAGAAATMVNRRASSMSGVIDAGSERRNVSDDLLEKWSLAPASFLNLTYAIRKPLNGLV